MRYIISILLIFIHIQFLGQNTDNLKQRLLSLKEKTDSLRPKYFASDNFKIRGQVRDEYYRVYDSINQTVRKLLNEKEFVPGEFFENEKLDDLFNVKRLEDGSLTVVSYYVQSFGHAAITKGFLQYRPNESLIYLKSLDSLFSNVFGIRKLCHLNNKFYLLIGEKAAGGRDLYDYAKPIMIRKGKIEMAKNLFPMNPDSFTNQKVRYHKSDFEERLEILNLEKSILEILPSGLRCKNCHDNFSYNEKTKSFHFTTKTIRDTSELILKFNGKRFVIGK